MKERAIEPTAHNERLRVLIVDDEPLARRRLARVLQTDPEIEIIGSCANGREALAVTKEKTPDLIFLDVEMPGMTGFAFLEALDLEQMPSVIFVTAYDHYALQAFDVYAVDYLLKPFDEERFEKALRRAKERFRNKKGQDLSQRIHSLLEELKTKSRDVVQPAPLDRLIIKAEGRAFFLNTDEIDVIRSEGKYVRLQVGKSSYIFREAISVMEARLDPKKFLRIHRSTVVNIKSVKELLPMFRGEYEVVMKDGTRLTLSRRYRGRLQSAVGGAL